MDVTALPEEIAEQIFILLPVEDLLSCCLVNSQWRDAVNKNLIWKQHCDLHNNLEHKQCVVKPGFEIPKNDCEGLAPICKYREWYMREVHLRNNLRNNRCVKYEVPAYLGCKIRKIQTLDKYLLLRNDLKSMFHVWTIEETPRQVQEVPYLLQDARLRPHVFQSFEDCLLIVQHNLLQVYIIVDGVFHLKMCRIVDKDEHFSQSIPEIDNINSWYFANIWPFYCNRNHVETIGRYFVGIVESDRLPLNDSVMHIWDFYSGKKLKEDFIPTVAESVQDITCNKNSKYLYITLDLDSTTRIRCKIYCYNLETLQYTGFYVESDHYIPFMLFGINVVVLLCEKHGSIGSCVFLNSITGEKIVEKSFDNEIPYGPKCLDVYKDMLVFGSNNTVTAVDLNTQEQVCVLPVDFEVVEVYLLDYNMLLVGGGVSHFVLEVWDIKKNCRLYTLDDRAVLLYRRRLSRTCRILYSGPIHILQFW